MTIEKNIQDVLVQMIPSSLDDIVRARTVTSSSSALQHSTSSPPERVRLSRAKRSIRSTNGGSWRSVRSARSPCYLCWGAWSGRVSGE
jgi:hypothetical protein